MANIIDFVKKNSGNIIKAAGGAALLVAGVMGAIHGKANDTDGCDEAFEFEEVTEVDDESAEEPTEDTEPEG